MSTSDDFTSMPKDEFVRRFTAEMIHLVGPTYCDEERTEVFQTADYGEEAGTTYWEEPDHRADGPEECARTDYSYWE